MPLIRTVIISLGLFVIFVAAHANDQQQLTIEILCQKYPDKIKALMEALDLSAPGLDKVKIAVNANDLPAACGALVAYYQEGTTASWYRKPSLEITNKTEENGEAIIKDIFTFQTVEGRQKRTEAGDIDWNYLGPNDDKEWGYFVNRHGILLTLLDAYQQTGDPKYVQHFNDLVIDWVLNNPNPGAHVWTVTWRELEVGLRMAHSWPETFYGFLSAKAVSPVAILLMLSSIPEQANYIMEYHRIHHNWAAMEINGLATAAICWPEFRQANVWYDHALKAMTEEVSWEVYPDGVQKELTSHYHTVALRNFEEFVDISMKGHKTVPVSFNSVLEKMNNYLAYTVRPDGHGLLNNDADRDDNRDLIHQAARHYHRPDWEYIVSHGKSGQQPKNGPSIFFPWAGHMIFRNGWAEDAQWGFFDAGPGEFRISIMINCIFPFMPVEEICW